MTRDKIEGVDRSQVITAVALIFIEYFLCAQQTIHYLYAYIDPSRINEELES